MRERAVDGRVAMMSFEQASAAWWPDPWDRGNWWLIGSCAPPRGVSVYLEPAVATLPTRPPAAAACKPQTQAACKAEQQSLGVYFLV